MVVADAVDTGIAVALPDTSPNVFAAMVFRGDVLARTLSGSTKSANWFTPNVTGGRVVSDPAVVLVVVETNRAKDRRANPVVVVVESVV